MLRRLKCLWLTRGAHQWMTPRLNDEGKAEMRCWLCQTTRAVLTLGDDSARRRVYAARPDSRVVLFPTTAPRRRDVAG